MTVRIEVLEGAEIIEVMKIYRDPRCNVAHKCATVKEVMDLAEFYLMNDLELARKERFVPQSRREHRKAYKEVEKKSPYKPKGVE
jgi:hypothetical protein